ncbi:flagellar assembly protein FliH [Pleionea sp. CnH1-48]|uniref:flagellar assembly protein FliH n=1 Tax=Pleionea sp. CnH1-48 TaxID=2954494 RepID=UPI002097D240|nr:flagellar assembly protein FliH [Pleionea sp. CnH1-48]MCO7226124.1 flagellar assembly protein FliH [Pleionea sp. CnH1-48]
MAEQFDIDALMAEQEASGQATEGSASPAKTKNKKNESVVIKGETAANLTRMSFNQLGQEKEAEIEVEPIVEELIDAPPTAEEIEQIRQAAYDEGLEKGKEDGLQQGLQAAEAEVAQWKQRFEQLMTHLQDPLIEQQEAVEEALKDLTCAITHQLIRREIQQAPEQIVAVIREALSMLPERSQDIRVHLHPDDVQLVNKLFHLDGGGEHHWKVLDDPTVTRGGCQVKTTASSIDATIEKRIADIFGHIFGEQRQREDDASN